MARPITYIKTLKPNTDRVTRSYEAQLKTVIKKGELKTNTTLVFVFDFICLGVNNEGVFKYRIATTNRFFLNEKGAIIKKTNKAQKLALLVASVNDGLEIQVDKNYKLVKVTNTEAIRKKWNTIKSDVLSEFPDLQKMADDFTWQLQENQIQRVFIEDNFLNFFFSGVFNTVFDKDNSFTKQKELSNAIDTINIPIIEQNKLYPPKRRFSDLVTITLSAEINTNSEKLSLPKLNRFLGQLPTKEGEEHDLDFIYNGNYTIDSEKGTMEKGELVYQFAVEGLYKSSHTLTFNRLENER